MSAVFDFKGQRIVVVGAANGLGRATAELIADLGGEVVAMDVERADIPGGRFVEVDLEDPHSITHAAAQVDGPIHGICNVAGVGSGPSNVRIVTINYLGVRTLTEALRPKLAPRSAIICISSAAAKAWQGRDDVFPALLEQPDYDRARAWLESHADLIDGYAFSKRALNHWAEMIKPSLWAEKEIRINAMTPGLMDTRMPRDFGPAHFEALVASCAADGGRLIQPADQAWVVAFLVSSRSSTINGELLVAGSFGSDMMSAR